MIRALTAFFAAIPIAILGGLIGLGGAEFRLPVLVSAFGYPTRQAVPLNLAVSLVTVATALLSRGGSIPYSSLEPIYYGIGGMIVGAVLRALAGASLAAYLSERHLRLVVVVLLAAIGLLLLIEGLFAGSITSLAIQEPTAQAITGFCLGLAVGLVSSMLGVAGGELIIPILVFVFGAGIKVAGTGSLLISLPTVAVDVARFASKGAYSNAADWRGVIVPMAIGSIIGAFAGAWLAGSVPADWLKVALGAILLISSARMPYHGAKPANTDGAQSTA